MNQLRKTITVWKGTALAVCTVIGSGLLGLPGMTLEIGNVYSVAGGWLLITVAMVPLIYIFATLGKKYTSAAGLSKYAEQAMGPWGGLWGFGRIVRNLYHRYSGRCNDWSGLCPKIVWITSRLCMDPGRCTFSGGSHR